MQHQQHQNVVINSAASQGQRYMSESEARAQTHAQRLPPSLKAATAPAPSPPPARPSNDSIRTTNTIISDDSPHPATSRLNVNALPPHRPLSSFNVPNIPSANHSSSSLLDAVLGGGGSAGASGPSGGHERSTSPSHIDVNAIHRQSPLSAIKSNVPAPLPAGQSAQPAAPHSQGKPSPLSAPRPNRASSNRARRTPSTRSASNTETESWDLMSEADSRIEMNDQESGGEGGGGARHVEELARNVEKRKSALPHLESELAALNAQIKAAEERLARAQMAQAQENVAPQRG